MPPNFEASFDLDRKVARLGELEALQADPSFWSDGDRARRQVEEIRTLKAWITPHQQLTRQLDDAAGLSELLEAEPEETMVAELDAEVQRIGTQVEQLELQAMLQGPDDARDAILTIHPGAGGTESQDWAEMLMRMYVRWAERREFDVTVLDLTPWEEAGIKSVSLEI
ncbi:MAG: PCRF domain-containing protein, partial [Gemmatimonadales bacterium]